MALSGVDKRPTTTGRRETTAARRPCARSAFCRSGHQRTNATIIRVQEEMEKLKADATERALDTDSSEDDE